MQRGDFVRINYIGRLETGEVFDLTDAEVAKKEGLYNQKIHYGPIPIIVGANFLIKGLDDALLDMNVGDKKEIEIKPEDGFGERDAKLVRTVPRKFFRDQKVEPRQGMIVDFGGGTRGRIQSVGAGRIMVDFNNPLAGHTLKYELELKEKIDVPVEQTRSVFEFFGAKAEPIIDGSTVTIDIKMPLQLKEKISSLIMEYVTGIEKVNFVESYEKKG